MICSCLWIWFERVLCKSTILYCWVPVCFDPVWVSIQINQLTRKQQLCFILATYLMKHQKWVRRLSKRVRLMTTVLDMVMKRTHLQEYYRIRKRSFWFNNNHKPRYTGLWSTSHVESPPAPEGPVGRWLCRHEHRWVSRGF